MCVCVGNEGVGAVQRGRPEVRLRGPRHLPHHQSQGVQLKSTFLFISVSFPYSSAFQCIYLSFTLLTLCHRFFSHRLARMASQYPLYIQGSIIRVKSFHRDMEIRVYIQTLMEMMIKFQMDVLLSHKKLTILALVKSKQML